MSENHDHYDRGGMFAFLFSMVFVFAFFIYIVAIHKGIDLGENIQAPPSSEQLAAEKVDVSGITEPWLPNEDMVKHGKKLFAQNCALCHGDTGHGDGASGAALVPKPRDLVKGQWTKGGGYIGLFEVITHGIPGSSMIAYGAVINAKDRWALTQFIDSITENKVQEDPAKVADFGKTAK